MYVKGVLLCLPIMVSTALSAQLSNVSCPAPSVLNTLVVKAQLPNRTPMPYPGTREADIMSEKWIWRTIDMREKMNQPYYYPFEPSNNRANLLSVIYCGIFDGKIIPYKPSEGDGFEMEMTKEEAFSIGRSIDSTQVPDLYNPDIMHDTVIFRELDPKDVMEYHVKEIWFFDRQRSMMDVRIIGICPVRYVYGSDGEFRGKQEMFWLYFPQLRNVLAVYQYFNRFNNVGALSYDDVFAKRMFSSYIYKESNVYDRTITDYSAGMDVMMESERIKHDMINNEQDLWDW